MVSPTALIFDGPFRANTERSTARLVSLKDRRVRIDDDAAGREVRPTDHILIRVLMRHARDEIFDFGVWMIDQMQGSLAQLRNVVRRDRRRHADRNAG